MLFTQYEKYNISLMKTAYLQLGLMAKLYELNNSLVSFRRKSRNAFQKRMKLTR